MADIAQIKSGDQVVDIVHPATKEPIGLRIKVMPLIDDRMKRIKNRITDERLRLDARGKAFKAEQIEENKLDLTVAAIVDWEWYVPEGMKAEDAADWGGERPDFNRKIGVEMLGKVTWIAEQLQETIGDTESFFTA